MARPPLPPFTLESATQKVQAAEDAWNTRDPDRVALAYTEDSQWRNRAEFLQGRDAIREVNKAFSCHAKAPVHQPLGLRTNLHVVQVVMPFLRRSS